jgi:CheY-like chemotaxis protein
MNIKTILLVDDEKNVRESLVDVLEDKGYTVIQAESGDEAIDKIRKEKTDLVLLDTQMPGMDGIETCRRIKKVENIDVKIIIYTGKIDAIDAVKAREVGVDDYCVKGSNPVYLFEAIQKLL